MSVEIPEGWSQLWRGVVNPWECDDNGHMNVRFYAERLFAGLPRLALVLGLPRAFTPDTPTTIVPAEVHIRFSREAFTGQTLFLRGAIVSAGADTVETYQELVHIGSGERSITARIVLRHVDARTAAPMPWPHTVRSVLEHAAKIAIPPHGLARSIDIAKTGRAASVKIADELGVAVIGLSSIEVRDTDIFGRMRPATPFGRQSDSVIELLKRWRAPLIDFCVPDDKGERRLGGALLEHRVLFRRWPRAGSLIETRGGLLGLGRNVQHFSLWHLDPVSGEPWATSESIAAALDLTSRKIVTPTPPIADIILRDAIPGFGI